MASSRKDKSASVYGLFHPITGKIFYVGCTTSSLEERLLQHCNKGKQKSHSQQVYAFVGELLKQNLKPVILLLEYVEMPSKIYENSYHAERLWIDGISEAGFPLLNCKEIGRKRTGTKRRIAA